MKTYTDGVLDERKRVRGLVEDLNIDEMIAFNKNEAIGYNQALTDLLALLDEGDKK